MADVLQWHWRRVAACVLVLFYVNRRSRKRKRWKNRKFWTKPYISSCSIFACSFLVSLYAGDEMSHKSEQLWTSPIKRNVVSRSSSPSAILLWSRKTREQSACFNWLKATNTRLPIVHTSNTSLPTRKKLVKKLARIEASSICREQFANLFADCLCAVHTHQLEFANTSLPTLVCRVKAALGCHIQASLIKKYMYVYVCM